MLMRDQPLAVNLAEAYSRACPHIVFLPVFHRSSEPIEAVAEGHIIACADAQVAHLEANRTLEFVKTHLPEFSIRLCSYILQRGHDVKRQDVRRIVGHDSIYVLGADRLYPIIY